MILVTHAVVGAGLAKVARINPVLAFIVGFASHFLLDTIPHWDYPLRSSTKFDVKNPLQGDFIIGRDFFIDLIKIGIDFSAGLILSYVFFAKGTGIHDFLFSGIVWGALGGMTPDFLQFVYTKYRHEPLVSLQKFHLFMHAEKRLNDRTVLGPLFQVGIIFITVLLLA